MQEQVLMENGLGGHRFTSGISLESRQWHGRQITVGQLTEKRQFITMIIHGIIMYRHYVRDK